MAGNLSATVLHGASAELEVQVRARVEGDDQNDIALSQTLSRFEHSLLEAIGSARAYAGVAAEEAPPARGINARSFLDPHGGEEDRLLPRYDMAPEVISLAQFGSYMFGRQETPIL